MSYIKYTVVKVNISKILKKKKKKPFGTDTFNYEKFENLTFHNFLVCTIPDKARSRALRNTH